ncbi:MAG TPA: hypothetical protein VFT91_08680 [Dehalococcoidia bacterium]|nr:hypothetical protein [Dehalococcoidia bacterium]
MLRRIRGTVRREREPDPLVKVAGVSTRDKAEGCLETLRGRGMYAELREDGARSGAYELWVHASVEPLARLVLGLSGRSVIRVARPKGEDR